MPQIRLSSYLLLLNACQNHLTLWPTPSPYIPAQLSLLSYQRFEVRWILAAEGNQDVSVRAEQLAQVAAGMKRRELLPLDRLHPLVAILSKALQTKDKLGNSLEGGKKLVTVLLEKAIAAHSSPDATPYPYLLVRGCISCGKQSAMKVKSAHLSADYRQLAEVIKTQLCC